MKFEDTKLLQHPEVEKAYNSLFKVWEKQARYPSDLKGVIENAIGPAEILSAQYGAPNPHLVAASLVAPRLIEMEATRPAAQYQEAKFPSSAEDIQNFLSAFEDMTVNYADALANYVAKGKRKSPYSDAEYRGAQTILIAQKADRCAFYKKYWGRFMDHRAIEADLEGLLENLAPVADSLRAMDPAAVSVISTLESNYADLMKTIKGEGRADPAPSPKPPAP